MEIIPIKIITILRNSRRNERFCSEFGFIASGSELNRWLTLKFFFVLPFQSGEWEISVKMHLKQLLCVYESWHPWINKYARVWHGVFSAIKTGESEKWCNGKKSRRKKDVISCGCDIVTKSSNFSVVQRREGHGCNFGRKFTSILILMTNSIGNGSSHLCVDIVSNDEFSAVFRCHYFSSFRFSLSFAHSLAHTFSPESKNQQRNTTTQSDSEM